MEEFDDLGMNMNVENLDKYCPRGLNRSLLTESEYRLAPFNDSCLEAFFNQLKTSLRRFNEWEEIVYTSIYIILSVLAVIGNGLVILVVIRKKAMRTNRNVLILNLALSNLVLAIINIPFLWLPSIDFEFPYSRFFCKFANVLPGSNIYCSTLTISVMAIDRYYSVKQLKLTSNRRQSVKALCISLFIWVFSFVLSLPLLIYYDTSMLFVVKNVNILDDDGNVKQTSHGWRQCRLGTSRSSEMSTQSIQLLMSILQVTFLYLVPLFVLSIFNVKLTRFLKSNANQMSRNRITAENKRKNGNDKKSENGPCLVTLSSPSVPSVRSSIAERASDRRTSRTTSLLIAMAGSYAALWLPFTLVSLLLDLDILYDESHVSIIERIDQTCKMVSMLSICINPFLYGFLNTNFRHEFSEIYYRYLRCRTKPLNGTRFTHEFSSMAMGTRQNSIVHHDDGLLSSFRRSIQGSVYKLRASIRSDASAPISYRPKASTHVTIRPSSANQMDSDLINDHIVIDSDSQKDSSI